MKRPRKMQSLVKILFTLMWISSAIPLGYGSRHRMARPLKFKNIGHPQHKLFDSGPKKATGLTSRKDDFGESPAGFMNILDSLFGTGQPKNQASSLQSQLTKQTSLSSVGSLVEEMSPILNSLFGPGNGKNDLTNLGNPKLDQSTNMAGLQSLASLFLPSNAPPVPKKVLPFNDRHQYPLRYNKVPSNQVTQNLSSSPNPFELIGPLINEIAPVLGYDGNLTVPGIHDLITEAPTITRLDHKQAHPAFGDVSSIFKDPLTGINLVLGHNPDQQAGLFAQNPLLLSFHRNASLAPLAPVLESEISQGLGTLFQNSDQNYTTSGLHSNIGNVLHDFLGQTLNRSVSSLVFPNGIPKPNQNQMTTTRPGPTKPPGYTCKKRVMMVEEVIYEESVKCEDIVEEECFPSYRTIYQPMKVEECETIFKKVCYIAFKNVAREKSVQICQEKKSRDCNMKGRETCTLEEETVCETFKDPTMRTSCQMKMETVCDYDYQGRPINCAQIPKRKCRGRQAKAFEIGPPQTECYNFPRKICGPEVCPLVTVPNVCEMKNETVVQEIPDEECKMEPQKECRVVTKIVPKLDTQEDCVEVHKEICNNVRNPVKVRKPSIRTWCGIIPQETSMPKKELRTKLFVALGCDEYENHITDVEIIALSNQNPPDFKMNLSSRVINDPSDFPYPSNSTPIGGFIGGKPWVCAGLHREGFCTFFDPEANKWEISLKLETLRSSPGSFVDEANDQLWITGGFSVKSNALLNSTEILVKGQNIAQGPDLPLPLMAHCAVNVNSTHYMVIGGFSKSYSSTDQVHLVQKETGHCQEMDSLILGRAFHTCGKIESTRGPEIVVIGGFSYDGLANHLPIEVFSLTTKNWRTERATSQNLTQVVSVEFNSTLLIVGGFSPDNIFELNKETFELMPRKEVLAQKKNSVVAMLIPDNFAYEIKATKIEVPTNPMTVAAGFLFADATGFDEMKYFNPDSNDICPTRIPSRWDLYDLHTSGFLMNGLPWICSEKFHSFPASNCLKYDMEEQDWLPPTFTNFLLSYRTIRNPCQLTPNKVWITGGSPYVEHDEWDRTSVVIENGVADNGPEFPEKDYGFGLHSTVLLERNQTFVTGFNGKHYTYIYNWTDDSWNQVSRTENDYIIDCELLRDRNFVYCLSIFNLELPRKSPLLQRQTDHNFVKSIWTFDLASSMWSLVTQVETSYFEGRFIRLEGGLYFIALNEPQLTISKVNEDTLVLGPAKMLPSGFSPYTAIPFDVPGLTNCSTITDTIQPSPIPEQLYFFVTTEEGFAVYHAVDLHESICHLPRPGSIETDEVFSFALESNLWSCARQTGKEFNCQQFYFEGGLWESFFEKPLFGSLTEIVPFNSTTALLLRSTTPSMSEGTFISSSGTSRGPELPIHSNNMQFVRVDENHFFLAVWDSGYTLPELISSEGNHFPGDKIESTPFLDCSSHICTSSSERCVICISTPQPTRAKVWQFQIPSLDGTELSFLPLEREVQDAKFIEVGADQLFLIVQDDVFDTFYLFDNNLREFKPIESIPSTSKSPLDIVGLLMESSPCVGGDTTPQDMQIAEPDATTILAVTTQRFN